MSEPRPRIRPLGDAAWLVEFATVPDLEANAKAHRLAATLAITLEGDPAWGEPLVGIAGVMVPFDALAIAPSAARTRLAAILRTAATIPEASEPSAGDPVEIAVHYGGGDGPDLEEVASRLGLAPEEVVRRHVAGSYRVLAVGFIPGLAYLGPLDPALQLPRRSEPRTRIPAGSVAIATSMTTIFPTDSPAGWHIIGRTDAQLWDPASDPPTPFTPGRRVRFRAAGG